ncbi:MAG: VWA domain-containing protein [Cyanobacteria bacterium J06641_5]
MERYWGKTRAIAIMSLALFGVTACGGLGGSGGGDALVVKFLAGSALKEFCHQAAEQFNQQNPKLASGERYVLECEAKGSGDVVSTLMGLAQGLQAGTVTADAPEFPTIVSVDGGIYHAQLIFQMEQLYPGQNYIPSLTDAPLLAFSPMVLIAEKELAAGLQDVAEPYKALAGVENHQQLDANAPSIPIRFVHTAPTRSNSGLQTLVAQFAGVSGKRPEELTAADVSQHQDAVRQIQSKITRYGVSTGSLARDMVKNGPFWASVGSVYESLVIQANTQAATSGGRRYEAVYPPATFTSSMRAILPAAPWVSDKEKAAAQATIAYLQSPEAQAIAANLGLRPGAPGIPLGPKFSPQFGVETNPSYDSYRPPQPDAVVAMLESWKQYAKKPSLVAIVVDSSGSMRGNKIAAVQDTLRNYIDNLGPKERIALIDFDTDIRQPVIIDGTPQGKNKGYGFIASLQAEGGTRLYDSALFARNWLLKNLKAEAINAVLVLTDGEDEGSAIDLNQLGQALSNSGIESDRSIAFFTVGYGEEGEFNPEALEQIADLNGGYYRKGDPQTIARLLADLQVEF